MSADEPFFSTAWDVDGGRFEVSFWPIRELVDVIYRNAGGRMIGLARSLEPDQARRLAKALLNAAGVEQ